MKIMQVITGLGPGGAEKIVAMLSEGLLSAGHSVTVVSLLPAPLESEIPDRLAAAGVEIVFLNAGGFGLPLFWKLRRVVRRVRPDVVHAHLIHANLLSRLACLGLGIPLVNTVHTAERRPGKGIYFLADRLTCFLACGTAVSRAVAAFHENALRLPPGSMRVIYNGVETVFPAPEELRKNLLEKWNPDGADKIVASIGRIDAMKGYGLLLDRLSALSKLIPPGRKWLFLIFGDGPEREKLIRRAAGLRFENITVRLVGFRADAAPMLAAADVFLSASLCEGYGLAVAEAMTLGLPVVCNSVDAIPELCALYDGDSFLFDFKNDPDGDDLAIKLLAASECAHSAGKNVSPPALMIASYLNLYKALLKARARKKKPRG